MNDLPFGRGWVSRFKGGEVASCQLLAKRMSRDLFDEERIDLLLNELYPGKNREVPDPWYGTEEGYHSVFDMMDKACDQIILKYSTHNQ